MSETGNAVVGIVGGSGLYEIEGLRNVEEVKVKTPFGSPSAPLIVGTLDDAKGKPAKLVFLPRHGRGDFYAEPTPEVKAYKVGRHWHAGKVLFEKDWLRRWF